MQIARDIPATRAALAEARRAGRRIGFVPTMGALHAGHASLLAAAQADHTFVVASIFVNPAQFAPGEDFARYPRDEAGDLAACEAAGADLVFVPRTDEMFPPGAATSIHVAGLTDHLCGPFRPGHFDGVCTIVAKLFHIVEPDAAYFGEKDAQQLRVIRRMTRDLDLPIEIVGRPTVRESDGLALSSRNRYLSADERGRAARLHRALCAGRDALLSGVREAAALVDAMRAIVDSAQPARVDYISVVDDESVQPVARVDRPVLLALAVHIGRTRLIDNLRVDPAAGGA